MPNYGKTRTWSWRYLSFSFYFDSTEHTYPCPTTKGKSPLSCIHTPVSFFFLSAAHFQSSVSLFVLSSRTHNTQQCVLSTTIITNHQNHLRKHHTNPLLPHNFFYRRTNMPLLKPNGSSPSLAFLQTAWQPAHPSRISLCCFFALVHFHVSHTLVDLSLPSTYLSSHPPPSPQPTLSQCACTLT